MVLPAKPGVNTNNTNGIPGSGNLGSPIPNPQNSQVPRPAPIPRPDSIEATGLELPIISDLILKVIYFNSYITGQTVCEAIKLPFYNVVDKALALLKKEQLIETTGSASSIGGERGYQYTITGK